MLSSFMRFTKAAAVGLLCACAVACGAPSSNPPAASATMAARAPATAPTSAPNTPAATIGDAPTAVARPTQTVTQSLSSVQPAASSGTSLSLVLDPSTSQAMYHAHEQLVGKSLPSEAVGTSKSVAGSVVIAAAGSVAADQSRITVDLSKLQSDESRRDNFIKSDTLQTSRFPLATFVPRQVQGLPTPVPTSGSQTFQLLGDLTVHGVTKPVTWQVTAQFADTTVSGDATTDVKLTDFGMTPPRVGPVLNLEDGLTLELAFNATRSEG
jgi:polyisoprenoid-binding protein YceI